MRIVPVLGIVFSAVLAIVVGIHLDAVARAALLGVILGAISGVGVSLAAFVLIREHNRRVQQRFEMPEQRREIVYVAGEPMRVLPHRPTDARRLTG